MTQILPLFVYGTLMSGNTQAAMLGRATRAASRVRGRLWSLPAGYPALEPIGEAWVHGELVTGVPPGQLAVLDAYEGVGEGLYRRVVIDAHVGLRTVAAWAWVMDRPQLRGGRAIPGGRWRSIRRR